MRRLLRRHAARSRVAALSLLSMLDTPVTAPECWFQEMSPTSNLGTVPILTSFRQNRLCTSWPCQLRCICDVRACIPVLEIPARDKQTRSENAFYAHLVSILSASSDAKLAV